MEEAAAPTRDTDVRRSITALRAAVARRSRKKSICLGELLDVARTAFSLGDCEVS